MSGIGVIPAPQHRARCKTCLDDGFIEVEDCTCLPEPGARHEEWCGIVPCPEGCADG